MGGKKFRFGTSEEQLLLGHLKQNIVKLAIRLATIHQIQTLFCFPRVIYPKYIIKFTRHGAIKYDPQKNHKNQLLLGHLKQNIIELIISLLPLAYLILFSQSNLSHFFEIH